MPPAQGGDAVDAPAAFALTLLLEVPVLLGCWRALGWTRPWWRAVAVAAGVQVTNPLLWLVHPAGVAGLLGAEVLIVAVEGLAAWTLLGRPRPDLGVALLVALISNALSFGVGLLTG